MLSLDLVFNPAARSLFAALTNQIQEETMEATEAIPSGRAVRQLLETNWRLTLPKPAAESVRKQFGGAIFTPKS